MEENFLYLTTTGRNSGEPRHIEIWFVEHGGCYYMVSEGREQSNWVKNIRHNSEVNFSVGSRTNRQAMLPLVPAIARAVELAREPELADAVAAKMQAKYNWSDGLIVELKPR